MVRMLSCMFLLLLAAAMLASCASSQAPQAQSAPQAVEIRISDGTTVQVLRPGDTGYAPIAQALADLIANLDEKARTYYDQDRFQTELGALPSLIAEYGQEVVLVGEGLQVRAIQLAVVCPGGDKIVLAQPADEAVWAVYLTNQDASFDALLKVIKAETGVDLLSASSQ